MYDASKPDMRGLEAEAYQQSGYFTAAQARSHGTRSNNSMGYFLERGMTRDFSFHQTKPGIEISAEPRMAQSGRSSRHSTASTASASPNASATASCTSPGNSPATPDAPPSICPPTGPGPPRSRAPSNASTRSQPTAEHQPSRRAHRPRKPRRSPLGENDAPRGPRGHQPPSTCPPQRRRTHHRATHSGTSLPTPQHRP